MSLIQLRERIKRCSEMAQRNEDDLDCLDNRVAELELQQTITQEKLLKQSRTISELTETVAHFQTVMEQREGYASQGYVSEAVTPAEVTPTRAVKRIREPCDTPTTKTAVHRDCIVTESVTPSGQEDCTTEGRGNRKRVRRDRGDTFKLTFDETSTQPPAPPSQ